MKLIDGRQPADLPKEVGMPPARAERVADAPATPGAAPRVRNYEELDGAEGRAVFFRPDRHTAAELAPLRGTVVVLIDRKAHECPLLDVSSSGVAFSWPSSAPFRRGERIAIALRFEASETYAAHEAFRGSATVGSIRDAGGDTVVGVAFDDFLLDVGEVLQLRTVRSWRSQHDRALSADRSWSTPGSDRFKALVAELRLLLCDANQELDALERELPWHVLQGPENPARTALVSRLRAEFVPPVVKLAEQIDAAVRLLPDGHASAVATEWSLRHVDEYLMKAPFLHRARHKPFGYPGDYEVMNFLYERNFEGASLFARAVNLAFTQMSAGEAVRARKDVVKRHLRELLARRAGSERPVKVLSIAAGPAQELFELLNELEDVPAPLEVVLFEQDKNALAHAWRRLRTAVDARFADKVKLTFLHESIKRLLRDADLFASFGPFDLTYSCGLYDYLQLRTAVVLTRRLSGVTAPGGQLLVANMVDHSTRWLMEHHLQWPLIYRTREDLAEMGARAVPGAQLRILEEASGVNPFVEVVRA